ncbi:MAG: hypothetical protein RDU83_08585 [bacterium]|nr:hypothetical protein [bacterium]
METVFVTVYRALLVVLVVAVAVPPVAQVAAGPAPSLFPLVAGAVWTRKSDEGTESVTKVVGPKTVGTVRCVVAERKAVERGRERIDRTCYQVTAAEILIIEWTSPRGGLTLSKPARPLMKLPPKAGQTWSWSPADSAFEMKITSKWIGEETVKVAAGTYKAWKLQTVTAGEDTEITAYTWYAPGVGAVRSERKGYRGDTQISGWSELVSYKAP